MNSEVAYYRRLLSAELEAAEASESDQEEEEHRQSALRYAKVLRALEPTALEVHLKT